LPDEPLRRWDPRVGGYRSKEHRQHDETEAIEFIREVYGPYLGANRLYAYIRRHDPALMNVIVGLKRNNKLPPDIYIPSRDEIVDRLIERAAKEGRRSLSGPERRSVRLSVWYRARKNQL
jgi:hypothetical protein